jgi:hypothetical protein
MSSASPLSFPSKHSRECLGVRGGRVPRGELEKLAGDPFFAERGELERSLENVEPPRASGDEPSHAPAAAAASRARSAAAGNENFFSFGDAETRGASAFPGTRVRVRPQRDRARVALSERLGLGRVRVRVGAGGETRRGRLLFAFVQTACHTHGRLVCFRCEERVVEELLEGHASTRVFL